MWALNDRHSIHELRVRINGVVANTPFDLCLHPEEFFFTL
jgi:hypothetical protein